MKTLALVLVLSVVLPSACKKEVKAPDTEPPAVQVAAATKGTLTEWIHLSGRVVPPPDRHSNLAPRVEGVLSSVSVQVGDHVRKGQILAQLDTALLGDVFAEAEASERSAAADADAKRKVATRTQALLSRGVVSGEQAETDDAAAVAAEAAFAHARTEKTSAARKRAWAAVTAPFDGVIVNVLRHVGEPVDGTAATPVIELSAEHPLAIALDATAEVLGRLKAGQDAEVLAGTPHGSGIPARVTAVASAIDPKTGTGPVRVDPATDESVLILGRTVEARIAVATHEAALSVPAAALRGGAEGSVEVVVVEDHKAHVRKVETGIRDGDRVEITSGLTETDRVVIDDPIGLADDSPVRDQP